MTTVLEPTPMTSDARRELVQASGRRSYRRRTVYSHIFMGLIGVALLIAFVPLFSILQNVIGHGYRYLTWHFLTTPQLQPDLNHPNSIGGAANAITGTLLIDGLALLLSVPIAMVLATALYESTGRVMKILRGYVEVMIGLPSILLGIFIYVFVVTRMGYRFTALAGVLALTMLMVPLMTVACELALQSVPLTLKEAAMALGARPSRVMARVLVPYALPRMLTGIILSLSRAVGETAPIFLIIGTSLVTNWNPLAPTTSIPSMIFNYLNIGFPAQKEACWGLALILIVAVFVLNLISRLIVARSDKGRN